MFKYSTIDLSIVEYHADLKDVTVCSLVAFDDSIVAIGFNKKKQQSTLLLYDSSLQFLHRFDISNQRSQLHDCLGFEREGVKCMSMSSLHLPYKSYIVAVTADRLRLLK